MFLKVAEHGSIGKAAEREHISAPAISKRIIELEHALGVTLFERQSVGVRLTAAGSALAVEVKEVLLRLDRMKSTLSEYASGTLGHVKILFSPSGQLGSLPRALKAFMIAHPNVEVHLEERRAVQVVQGVARGDGDIGIFARHAAGKTLSSIAILNVRPYQTLRLVVVTHRSHPLAKRKAVTLADAVKHDFVSFGQSGGLGQLVKDACSARGLRLRSRLDVTTFDSARRMIQAGLGIGIMCEQSAAPYAAAMGLRCIKLAEHWAEYDIDICTRATEVLSKPARLMLRHLFEMATGPAPAEGH
ncbi:MAG: LysR family transcriptional regulator [Burkholderiales bacterium]|nr:LysR family transcriptional regulator [Burkholderiales bacterium]